MSDFTLKKHVLVTGANGFIGHYLTQYLRERGFSVRAAVRQDLKVNDSHAVAVGDVNSQTHWSGALDGIDCVVHLAGRAHIVKNQTGEESTLYFTTNTQGTLHLAEEVVKSGIRRFIFISSIKVNGEESCNAMFQAADKPEPGDDYARSKLAAEEGLAEIAARTGIEIVVIRPPLVYGKGVGGNFARLLSWVKKGFPVPLKAVKNRRSLVYVENLCDLIVVCVEHPKAIGRTLLVSDGQDISTAELVEILGDALNQPGRLVFVPLFLLKSVAWLFGRNKELQRLTGNLAVNSLETRKLLHWTPPCTLQEGIKRSVT